MIEYKVMNREELRDYIFDFWNNWGAFNYEERDDDEIKYDIYNNLGSLKGIETELDYLRQEFEAGWDEDSKEYEDLDKLWNYINWYKTDFQKREVI